MAAMLGTPLMPWQQYVADVACEIDPNTGWWAYDKVVLTVQRRAGKTALDNGVKVDRMATTPRGKLWTSAQGGEEAIAAWRELCGEGGVLDRSPLRRKVRTYTTTGKERTIWTPTGAELSPIPPNGDKLHGKAVDSLHLDELWVYDAEQAAKMKAGYRPTFLTTNAQAWLVSTMGSDQSVWLNQERDEGRRAVELGANRGTAYFEWSVPRIVDGIPVEELGVDDLIRVVISHHPAAGVHPLMPVGKLEQFIRDDLDDPLIGHRGVLRAYANVSTADETEHLIHAAVIAATASLEQIPRGVVPALAFDVDPKLRAATISAAWRNPSGVGLLEVIQHGLGTRWVAAEVIGYMQRNGIKRVTCNNAGPARDVADTIEAQGFQVDRVSGTDYSAACVRLHEELKAKRPSVVHMNQEEFVTAVPSLAWRKLGAGLAFDTTGDPITPVTSCTLALWGADHPVVERPVGKPRVITV